MKTIILLPAVVFSNKFNYHAYRYLKLTNLKEAPALSSITASLVHTDYSGESFFSCSDKDLNAIHDMIQYTLRCLTLGGYMVDCPARSGVVLLLRLPGRPI